LVAWLQEQSVALSAGEALLAMYLFVTATKIAALEASRDK
jgi:hypothetical protein